MDSEPIVVTIACHCVWKTKKNVTKLKSVNKLIKDAKKEDKEIEAKKVASKKKVAEKRKATSELRKAVMTASVAVMAPIQCSRQGCEPLRILDPGSR